MSFLGAMQHTLNATMTSLGLSTLFASLAFAQGPGPQRISLAGFTYAGTGCPSGSVASNVASDKQAVTLLFDRYVVDSSSSPAPVLEKTCRLNFRLQTEPGWRYALFSVDYRGFADLESGARAQQSVAYAFGSGAGSLPILQLEGPVQLDYNQRQEVPLNNMRWSGCSGDEWLSLDTVSRVDTSTPPVSRDVNLTSSQNRRAELDLGAQVLDINLVRQDSVARCEKGRSFGAVAGTRIWVDRGCRGTFRVLLASAPSTNRPRGLLTIDSIDGQLQQHFGVTWQRCDAGRWVQGNGQNNCVQTCASAGLRPAADTFGAQCASGEVRPASATGMNFPMGCWQSCTAMGNLVTEAVGNECYAPGQKRDHDRTDRIAACYCK